MAPIGRRNTWSNVAYLLVGLAVGWSQGTPMAWQFAVAMAVLALGSGAYHAWKTRIANDWDWIGMYLVMVVLALHGWAATAPGIVLGTVSLAVVAAILFGAQRNHFDWHMGLLFLVSWIPAVWRGDLRLALVAFDLFVLAYLCWQLDKKRMMRKWGHALWHLFSAAAMGTLFLSQQ